MLATFLVASHPRAEHCDEHGCKTTTSSCACICCHAPIQCNATLELSPGRGTVSDVIIVELPLLTRTLVCSIFQPPKSLA